MVDVAIIGAGPVGLACAIEARRRGLTSLVIEKGALVNSLAGYPTGMEFFSTPELLEIGDHPFPTQGYKPLREEALDYYRRVADAERLDLALYERVTAVVGEAGAFEVVTVRGRHACRFVVAATGFFDHPNRLSVPGEDLPHVTHYFREPYPYARQRVAVIGAKNSAAKAALQCYRHGARVTMLVRGPELSPKIKYWIRPDLENRIAEGSVAAFFGAHVESIEPGVVHVRGPQGPFDVDADWVLAMTGYRPDYSLLATLGVAVGDDEAMTPLVDSETFESSRPGLYLAGTVCGGLRTSRWFIENGRFHAAVIAAHVASRPKTP